MGTCIKWNGKWINLDAKTGNANVRSITLNNNLSFEQLSGTYKFLVKIPDIDEKCSAALFLDYNKEIITQIKCSNNFLEIFMTELPQNSVWEISGFVMYGIVENPNKNNIYYIGGFTEAQIQQIIPIVADCLSIQITEVNGKNKIEFNNVRQIIKARLTRTNYTQAQINEDPNGHAAKIEIKYWLEGDDIEDEINCKIDEIFLNIDDYPVSGSSSGINWEIEWIGFEEGVPSDGGTQ